jgi:hypothetical protein
MIALAASRDELTRVNGDVISADEVWQPIASAPHRAWRIERRVVAHPTVGGWRPGATPTVRLITALIDGVADVHIGMMKVPRHPSGVDNFHVGNLACDVDLATGRIGRAVNAEGTEWHETHPESGTPIAGVVIPDWPMYLDIVRTAAPAFSPLTSLGWDVAVSADGPVILEANTSWEEIVQLPLDRGILHGRYAALLRKVGAVRMFDRRRAEHPGWEDA